MSDLDGARCRGGTSLVASFEARVAVDDKGSADIDAERPILGDGLADRAEGSGTESTHAMPLVRSVESLADEIECTAFGATARLELPDNRALREPPPDSGRNERGRGGNGAAV